MAGICQNPNNEGYNVYKWNGTEFVKQKSFAARTLGVTTTDQLWVVNDQNDMFMPGEFRLSTKARDIAVGGPGNSVWIIGTDQRAGGYGVYQRAPASFPGDVQLNFTYADFAAVRIAVDKSGRPWVVNDTGDVYMYDAASRSWGKKGTKKARSVHTGASSGAVWMLGTDPIPGGFSIYQWDSAKQDWESYGTYGAVEMAEAAGTSWIVQSDGKLYSRIDPTTKPAPVELTQTWPSPTPQEPWQWFRLRGTLLCADTASNPTACGTTQADWVGKHELDTSCDSGFYDPIWGGTCWKCPDDDGSGGWIRSLTAVDTDTACWRAPKERLGRATKVKAPALAWDCPSGSFWDGYSPNGCCGSCWKCPDDLPRRTANHVDSWNACASPVHENSRAIFLKFNGCPKPDAATMSLTGKRAPGNPFLDVGAGGCYACPIVDETGNFLIAERNANPLYGNSNTGCTINVHWKPPAFAEPGLANMEGVKDVIWEQRLFDGKVTSYLYDLAEAQELGDATPAAREWVAARWQKIARSPYNNETMRSYMFVLLKAALAKKAEERTVGEKRLIQSFANYIRERRTYFAEQALAMYDSWRAWDAAFRESTGQSRSLGGMFYYGTVPYDFHGTLTGLMGLGGAGGSTIGSLVAVNRYVASMQVKLGQEGAEVIRTRSTLNGITSNPLKYLKMAAGARVVAGASLVSAAGLILSSIAIDQFVKIEESRPKLQAALDKGRQPVDLAALEEDTPYLYWSKAMDTGDKDDPQVIQMAAMGQVMAERSAYAAPAKTEQVFSDGTTDMLSSGTSGGFLNQGQKLVSGNKKYSAEMQSDGNFVIYTQSRQPIWATGTHFKGASPYKLAMQADGNLVVFGSSTAIWSTGPKTGTAPFKLIMQGDGNLVVYDNTNRPVWASNTARP